MRIKKKNTTPKGYKGNADLNDKSIPYDCFLILSFKFRHRCWDVMVLTKSHTHTNHWIFGWISARTITKPVLFFETHLLYPEGHRILTLDVIRVKLTFIVLEIEYFEKWISRKRIHYFTSMLRIIVSKNNLSRANPRFPDVAINFYRISTGPITGVWIPLIRKI